MTQQPNAKILLVDDDEYVLGLFQAILEPEGCTIVQARDGVEALDKFDKYKPDLVLLDLMLPRLNGYEVCARFRSNARTRHVPILMLSGLDDRDAKLQALESGVDDFLEKPVERVTLISRVRAMLKLHAYHQALDRQQSVLNSARDEVTRLHKLLEQAGEHNATKAHDQLGTLVSDANDACKRLDVLLG